MRCVGIDLGTTYSVIAYVDENGHPQVIPNLDGERTTPSVLDLEVDPPLVGSRAKDRQAVNIGNTVSFFKRQMNNPDATMIYNGRTYGPVEQSAVLLAFLKKSAEAFFNEPVSSAVITVPHYFLEPARESTKQAATLAGFDVLRIINEPTAAALSYKAAPGLTLVYDLGGGTFDVSIVDVQANHIEVVGVGGDANLGGKDWDDRLLTYVANRFYNDYHVQILDSQLNKLLVQIENAKRALSVEQSVPIRIRNEGVEVAYILERSQFEELTADLIDRTGFLTDHVLQSKNLDWKDLAGVLLIGGSTKMPMVREYVTARLGRPPLSGVNPELAVAYGAALEAARIMASRSLTVTHGLSAIRTLVDVTAHSLGLIVESPDRSRYINTIMIPRNARVPATVKRSLAIKPHTDPSKNRLEIFVTQGDAESPIDSGLSYLELRVVTGIPIRDQEETIIEVSYGYDQDGIVQIEAREKSTQTTLPIHVEPLPQDIPLRFANPPKSHAQSEPLTVYIAFDVSGSMAGEPIREARQAAVSFVKILNPDEHTRIGILSVANSTHTNLAASSDPDELRQAIDRVDIGLGKGNAAHPFHLIYSHLEMVTGNRYAIILADGVWQNQQAAIAAAQKCHQAGIDIIAIGFGHQDDGFLRAISSAGRDTIFAPRGGLDEAFSSIARELVQLRLS